MRRQKLVNVFTFFIFPPVFFKDSSFSTLLIFHTPHLPHSSSSTLLIDFPHSSFSTLLIFHTSNFPHSSFSTLLFHSLRITELGFNFLNKIIVFFMNSQVQKSIFGLFCQCLYSYQNKGPRGARVQNHSAVTHGYLNNLQKAIFLGLG